MKPITFGEGLETQVRTEADIRLIYSYHADVMAMLDRINELEREGGGRALNSTVDEVNCGLLAEPRAADIFGAIRGLATAMLSTGKMTDRERSAFSKIALWCAHAKSELDDPGPLTLNDYQVQAATTSILNGEPFDPTDIFYRTMGLAGEAGEIANKVKKILRDGLDPNAMTRDIGKELGDVLWYTAMLAAAFGLTMEQVGRSNLEKLANRKARGMISGSGDNR